MAKYKPEDLFDEIMSTHEICCSNCKTTDTVVGCDDFDACQSFFNDGWRKTTEKCYCPKCAKKKLKL